jgi:glycosyltransferase involved in cell wall biosynthesis
MGTPPKKITVYVPCRNAEATLPEVLSAIRAQTRSADQLVFINDRCTDRSETIAREHGFECHKQLNTIGLAAGRNLALTLAQGDLLLGVDSDCVLQPEYISQMEKVFLSHPDLAAVGGRMDERFTQSPPDLWRALFLPQHHGDLPILNPRLLYGATMGIRTDSARKLGGWNEKRGNNGEDLEICGRMKQSRMDFLYTPDCRGWHLRRDTLDSVLKMQWNWNYSGYEGDFVDLDAWKTRRIPIIWQCYRYFRVTEVRFPQLAWISLLSPWAWMMRDLNALHQGGADIGNIAEVAEIARETLNACGIDREVVRRTSEWLLNLAMSLDERAVSREKLSEQLVSAMRYRAMESIPDMNYNSRFRVAPAPHESA